MMLVLPTNKAVEHDGPIHQPRDCDQDDEGFHTRLRLGSIAAFLAFIPGVRVEAPNDQKLSDRGVRRGTCMAGGKAAAEAGAVTHGAVR